MFGLTKSLANSIKNRSEGLPNPNSGRRMSFIALALVAMLMAMALSGDASAQSLYGSITGTVTDANGAVLAGAKVQVLNTATGEVKESTTDDKGGYQFSDLVPAVYKVTITANSFKTLIVDNVKVDAATLRRADAQLEVAKVVNEAVTVTADAVVLQTDRADVNIVQSTRQVNDLPLTGSLGRNYQSLMELVPGAVTAGEQNSVAGNPQRSISFNVNGVSRLQNNTRIDGASVVYPWLPTNTVYVPPAESIQAVNIVTNSFDAEQGLAGGAAINLTIKTGTNGFHGVGWGYDTNSAFQSRRFFQPINQPQIPKNILAQFGYALSGPVYLPKIFNGKNKLFFFTDLERTTQRNAAGGTANVAPASLRPDANGNVNFTGTGTTILDPASNADPRLRTPFPNNTIPANRIDPAAVEILKRLPLPNLPGRRLAGATLAV